MPSVYTGIEAFLMFVVLDEYVFGFVLSASLTTKVLSKFRSFVYSFFHLGFTSITSITSIIL